MKFRKQYIFDFTKNDSQIYFFITSTCPVMDNTHVNSQMVRSVVQKLLALIKSERPGPCNFYYMDNGKKDVMMVASNSNSASVMHYVYNLIDDFNHNLPDISAKFNNAKKYSLDSTVIIKNIYQQISKEAVVNKEDNTNRVYVLKPTSMCNSYSLPVDTSDVGKYEIISLKTLTNYVKGTFEDICMDGIILA